MHAHAHAHAGVFWSVVLLVGAGAAFMWLLDPHAHTCLGCGRRWRHLGLLSAGRRAPHTCRSCGRERWLRDGETLCA